jgi:hypothetical protein
MLIELNSNEIHLITNSLRKIISELKDIKQQSTQDTTGLKSMLVSEYNELTNLSYLCQRLIGIEKFIVDNNF